jgi:putative addiction module component (TIGR02574 family)
MASQLENLTTEALKLTPEDRVQLAERLLASVFADKDIEDAWAEEIERRIQAIEEGRSQLVPAKDAIARARAAIK